MPDPIELPFCPAAEVETLVREIATHRPERLFLLDHARQRMAERDVTLPQILKVLRHGERWEAPRWDPEGSRGWRCKFQRHVAGQQLAVVAKLIKRDEVQCLVVTVHWVG